MTALASVGFLAVETSAIITSQQPGNNGIPYLKRTKLYHRICAYAVLILFILMTAANVVLIIHIRIMNKNLSNNAIDNFKKEKFTLAIILAFFGLSYLFRFLWDEFLGFKLLNLNNEFYFFLVYDIVSYADGLSFTALLLFHRTNFKVQTEV